LPQAASICSRLGRVVASFQPTAAIAIPDQSIGSGPEYHRPLKGGKARLDRAGLSVRLPTACPLHYSGTTELCWARTLLFIYYIVPAGGGEGDALVRGNLWTATVEAAKNYVPGVTAPEVKDRSGLEVILQDRQGNEIFRCRHKAGPP
jgi:hypothetical protein